VGIVGSLLVSGSIPSTAVFVVLLASVLLGAVTLLAVAADLRDRAPWAVHAIAPICYVVLVAGVFRVLVALSDDTITVPLEVIGSLMVLSRAHPPEHLPAIGDRERRRARLAVGVLVIAQLLAYAPGVIANPGPLGAQRDALDLRVAIDCTGIGAPDREILVHVDWSWNQAELITPREDALLVQWGAGPEEVLEPGGAAFFADQATTSDPATIWAGSAGVSAGLIAPMQVDRPSRDFVIEVGTAGLVGGSVEFVVRPVDPTDPPGAIEVWAYYAHGDRWLHRSETAACSW
jgi:hypothetical protein